MHVPEAKSAIVFSFSFHFLQTLLFPWLTWTSVPLCHRTLSHMFNFFSSSHFISAQIGENDLQMEKGRKYIYNHFDQSSLILNISSVVYNICSVCNHGNWLVNMSLSQFFRTKSGFCYLASQFFCLMTKSWDTWNHMFFVFKNSVIVNKNEQKKRKENKSSFDNILFDKHAPSFCMSCECTLCAYSVCVRQLHTHTYTHAQSSADLS